MLQFFIDNAPDEISRARYSIEQERSLGLGAMGWHSFLNRKRIPFDSGQADVWNAVVFQHIQKEAIEESNRLGMIKGGTRYGRYW